MLVCFRLPWKQRIDRKETVCSAAAHPGLPKKPKSFKMPSPSRWFPGTAKLNHHARLDLLLASTPAAPDSRRCRGDELTVTICPSLPGTEGFPGTQDFWC